MLHLQTFGTFDLRRDGQPVTAVLAQPKRAALFAYLVVARPPGYHRRDTLLALFWPELDESRARNALSQALSFLRRELGEPVVLLRGSDEIGVARDVAMCDAVDFEAAVAGERWGEAISLYAGDFLPGLHIDASELHVWLEAERSRFREIAAGAAWSHAHDLLNTGRADVAERVARNALELAPTDEAAARAFIAALGTHGSRPAALRFYTALETLLLRELELEPDTETRALADAIRRDEIKRDRPGPVRRSRAARGEEPGPLPSVKPSPSLTPAVPAPRTEDDGSDHRPGRSRLLRPLLLAVAPLGLVGGMAWLGWNDGAGRPAAPGPEEAVAVLPFSVRGGPEVAYLGEGLPDLLGPKLEEATGLRPIDGRALSALLEREGSGLDDLGRARLAATRLGAGSYILGSVVGVEGRLQLDAALYRADGRRRARATAEGEAADVFRLVDDLAAGLLAARSEDPLAELATTTTSSLPALKAYLAGERALREGRYDAARRDFVDAIKIDSAFALAYYRYTIACGWAGGCDGQWTLEGAGPYLDRLPPPARNLVDAQWAYNRGDNAEAERLYRWTVSARPDDVEAWFQLGEVLFHTGPLQGHPIAESNEAWLRLTALQPDHHFAHAHMGPIAAMDGDTDALRRHLSVVVKRAEEGNGPPPLQLLALEAIARGDTARQRSLMDEFRAIPEAQIRNDVWGLGAYSRDLEASKRFTRLLLEMDRSPYVKRLGRLALAHLEVAGGRLRAGLAQLDTLASSDPAMATAYAAQMLGAAYWPRQDSALAAVRNRLLQWQPGPSDYFAIARTGRYHDGQLPAIRAYLLGFLALKGGDPHEAERRAEELGRMPSPDSSMLVDYNLAIPDLRAGLRARILAAGEPPDSALRILESRAFGDVGWVTAYYHDFAAFPGERFLRASLLARLGRDDDALRLYASLPDASPLRMPYLAPSLLRRAEIHERRGQAEQAIQLYARMLSLWTDPDPELRPVVHDVRRRVARLTTSPP